MARRLILLFATLLLCAAALDAQVSKGTLIVSTDPAGSCSNGSQLRYNFNNGKLWGCKTGTWTQLNTSSSSTTAIPAMPATTVGFSATPDFDCGSPLANSVFAMTLTGDVTGPTLNVNCTANLLLQFQLTQDGTGGHTFTWMTGFNTACPVDKKANATTLETIRWDGTTAHVMSCNSDTGDLVLTGNVIAAPATPASGQATVYVDSTTKNLTVLDDAGVKKSPASFTTTGQGGLFLGLGYGIPPIGSLGTLGTSANGVVLYQFSLIATQTIKTISFNVSTLFSGGNAGIGIYDIACTSKLLETGAVLTTTTGIKTATITPVTLSPGVYWLAVTMDNTTSLLSAVSQSSTVVGVENAAFKIQATAGNTSTAGVLPATCGTLTADTSKNLVLAYAAP